jgi:hypothetical protein
MIAGAASQSASGLEKGHPVENIMDPVGRVVYQDGKHETQFSLGLQTWHLTSCSVD